MRSHEAFGAALVTPETVKVSDRAAERMLTKLQHENGVSAEAEGFARELAKGESFEWKDVIRAAMVLYKQKVEDRLDETRRSKALDESCARMCAEKEELTEDECAAGVVEAYELFVGGMDDTRIRSQLAAEWGDKGTEQQLNDIIDRMYKKYEEDAQRAA